MTEVDQVDQSALRELAGALAAELATPARVRAAMATGGLPDTDLDRELATTGLTGLELPEAYGGGGASFRELATVVEELGSRAAASHLITSAALGAGAILLGGSGAQHERWLPALSAGTRHATAALTEWCVAAGAGPGTGSPAGAVRAAPDGSSGWRLHGSAYHVLNARVSDLIVVPAIGPEPVVAVVARDAAGLTLAPVATTDATRCVDALHFDAVAVTDADVLAVGEAAEQLVAALVDRAAVAIAADSLGNAKRVLEMTADYTRQRTQFDRPIGSFQAVKHQAADMLVNTETAAVLVEEAARSIADEPTGAAVAASMAKEYGCERAATNAGIALQLHGGIGYTWEHDLHLYFKRATHNEFLFGDGWWHRGRIAETLAMEAKR